VSDSSIQDETGSPPAGSGRLAALLATRGGKAAPEAPFVVEHREALLYMLCEAAELEHGIMCQYLFAVLTLKQSTEEGLTGEQLAAVNRWRKTVAHVATQEMLHLALVQNLLSAVGMAPHMVRPNLPQPANHYPAGVRLALLPFGERALRHFMFLERPEGMDLDDAEGLAAMGMAQPLMSERDIVPRGQDFATVGHLYRSIEAGFKHLAEKHGEEWLFVGPPRAQATEAQFGWPELIPVTDLASAQRAIETIVRQGEGPRNHWSNAHFGQFVNVLQEYLDMREADPDFEPSRPVIAANVRPQEREEPVPLITDPVTAQVTDLFNVGYEILLQTFYRFFAHTEETEAQLMTLADTTVGLMVRVLKPLGALITTLPAGPDYPGRTAGPSFELFYEADYLLPHREAAWALLADRLETAAEFCDSLCGRADLARQLEPVRAALRELAGSIAAHLPAGDVRTRALAEPADTAAVLARAGSLVASRADAHQLRGLMRDGQVWEAAVEATRLRAGLPARLAEDATPLAEATAALQDLALRLAARPAEREQRLTRLRELQAGLPTTIQASRNGPYLVTNPPRLRDHLGEDIASAPQVVLCRCGGSTTKPLCDGACASNGFSGEKDPSRVPDRRDTYEGEQVTVFDNRGICQHSGFCTDRLPTVFRAGKEPFVAPSGGRMDEIIRAVRDCPSGALSYALGDAEARAYVDWDNSREPVIEVTKDGPYRITGGIPLGGAAGEPEARNEGSSPEHYALCRCGHSQNKPFCSGMHWYVDFRDPAPSADPTPFEWAGGLPALTRMTRLLYEKHVPADPLLAPVFANMPADEPLRLARWFSEALGGPAADGDGSQAAPPPGAQSGDEQLGEEQRGRWVELLTESANEAKLPDDAAFRSVLQASVEWYSRAALAAAQGPGDGVPRWGWGPGRPPAPAADADQAADQEKTMTAATPEPGQPVSFATNIRPLFREKDQKSMSFAFDLWSYDDVRANAAAILDKLREGAMPCDGAWPADRVELFSRWTETGMLP
jgi:CDGSH-type Zn-finger protein/truncated hemoglobin YjbI